MAIRINYLFFFYLEKATTEESEVLKPSVSSIIQSFFISYLFFVVSCLTLLKLKATLRSFLFQRHSLQL